MGQVGGATLTTEHSRGRVEGKEQRGVRTDGRVPPPGQKRGLDSHFASERPSNSLRQTLDCLFLAPVGAVKQDQGQFTSISTSSRGKL